MHRRRWSKLAPLWPAGHLPHRGEIKCLMIIASNSP